MGQKNKITRRWAKRRTRPTAPKDQRTRLGLISSARSAPETARARVGDEPAPGRNRHPDRAGRPYRAPGRSGRLGIFSGRLTVPPSITLIPLPAKCPELNPQENVWQFMRDNWLSNRIFKSYDQPSTTAATLGTSSSISVGGSCPSEYRENGQTSSRLISESWYQDAAPHGFSSSTFSSSPYRQRPCCSSTGTADLLIWMSKGEGSAV